MTPKEIWEVYSRSKEKINCIYKRSSGKVGHCYIDPTKPLKRGHGTSNYGYAINSLADLTNPHITDVTIGVFKQTNNVEIYVKPENLWIHSGKVEQVVKVLYG
jgi:hypothetical protein